MNELYDASRLAKNIENAINEARRIGIKVVICGDKILVENTAHNFMPSCIEVNHEDPFYKAYIELAIEESK